MGWERLIPPFTRYERQKYDKSQQHKHISATKLRLCIYELIHESRNLLIVLEAYGFCCRMGPRRAAAAAEYRPARSTACSGQRGCCSQAAARLALSEK